MKRNSLYVRLLFYFFILMIPLQIMGAVIIWFNNYTLRKSIAEVLSGELRQLARSFSGTVNGVGSQLHTLLYERDIALRGFPVTSAYMSPSEYWMELYNIRNRMEFIVLSNNIIDDIQLVYPSLGIGLSVRLGFSNIINTQDYVIRHLPLKLAYDRDRDSLCIGRMFPSLSYTAVNTIPLIILQATFSGNAIRSLLTGGAYPEYPAAFIYYSENKIYSNITDNELTEILLTIEPAQKQIIISGRSYSVFSETDEMLGFTVMRLLPDDVFYSTTRIFMWLLILYCLLTIPAILLYGKFIQKLVMKPVNMLEDAFHRMEDEQFGFSLVVDTKASEFNDLIDGFNSMNKRLDDLIHRVYRQEVYTRQIELKQLQAQINPHFLYNAFFLFRHMLKNEEYIPAVSLAGFLGEYFHYTTRSARTEVSLHEEYQHAVNYVNIQQMRYTKRLELRIMPLPAEIKDALVPRLIIQPIMENTFNHAMRDDVELILYLSFDFNFNEQFFCIIVEDNGIKLSDNQIHNLNTQLNINQEFNETTGVVNIHKRLKLYFGENYGLEFNHSDLGGLQTIMKFPIKNQTA